MAKKRLPTTKLIEYLKRSKLVAEDQLEAVLSELESARNGEPVEDSNALAQALVDRQLISRWQADNLLRGKYKGYFLGKYKLLAYLGSGGMSSVYLAEHTMMRRKQAIKVLPKRRVGDASYLERFRLEALATAALDHPNIVRAYDIDNEGDVHYFVMEYVAGQDLHSLVKAKGPLEFGEVADYVGQAAEGLQHAHEAGFIHRDVKPANLLLDQTGRIKILDLGLALFARGGDTSLTIMHNENVLGTADYLAPEQALSSHDVDYRADIYSLGCTFFFLLTGHPPFPEGTLAQRIAKHQTKMPPDIRHDRPDCPASLISICFKMVQKDPQHRYQSMREVAQAVEIWSSQYGGAQGTGHGDNLDALDQSGAEDQSPVEQSDPDREFPVLGGSEKAPPGGSSSGAESGKPVAEGSGSLEWDVGSDTGVGSSSGTLGESAATGSPALSGPGGQMGGDEPRSESSGRSGSEGAASSSMAQERGSGETESGLLELGLEKLAGSSKSGRPRSILEQRRERNQRRNRAVRWVWYVAIGLFLLIVLLRAATHVASWVTQESLVGTGAAEPARERRASSDRSPPLSLPPAGRSPRVLATPGASRRFLLLSSELSPFSELDSL